MKFTININKNDFYRFQKYAMTRIHGSPGMKWKATLFGVGYGLFLAVFLLEMYSVYRNDCCSNYEHLNMAMIALGVWFLLVNIWQQIYVRIFVSLAADENGTVLGEWALELTDSGIIESNEICSSTFTWQAIQNMESDKYNVYLFTDKLKALILPKSQLTEEIESIIRENVTNQANRAKQSGAP